MYTLKPGYCLKSRTGSIYLILKVTGDSYIQAGFDGRWSTQSRNEVKDTVITVWDGKFLNKVTLDEIDGAYDILEPKDNKCFETLEWVNNNYK